MSELNRALLAVYRLGADHTYLKALSTKSPQRIHRYLLDVAVDSPDTYTTLDELIDLLKIPYTTTYRCIQSLNSLGLLDSRRGKPQRRDGVHGAGGQGKSAWRARL